MWYKVKRIMMRPNGVEKQVRPSGWTPWANTLAYYSFDDQWVKWYVKDFSWNWYNLNVGTQPTYSLLSWNNYVWVYSGSWKCSVNSSYSWAIKTISMWFNINTQQSQYIFQFWISGDQFAIIYWYSRSKLEFYSDSPRVTLYNSLSLNTWYHVCLTQNNNNLWTVYINNSQTTTFTKELNSFVSISVWSSRDWDRMKWMLDNVIIETKARTAQEIADYYNLTKANYWL